MFLCDKCKIWEHKACLIDAIQKEYVQTKCLKVGKNSRKSWPNNIEVELLTTEETGNVTANIHDGNLKTNGKKMDQAPDVEGNVNGLVVSMPVK